MLCSRQNTVCAHDTRGTEMSYLNQGLLEVEVQERFLEVAMPKLVLKIGSFLRVLLVA